MGLLFLPVDPKGARGFEAFPAFTPGDLDERAEQAVPPPARPAAAHHREVSGRVGKPLRPRDGELGLLRLDGAAAGEAFGNRLGNPGEIRRRGVDFRDGRGER